MPPLISTLASISDRGYRSLGLGSTEPTPTISTPWVAQIGKFSGNSYNTITDIVVAPNGDFYISGLTRRIYSSTNNTSFCLTKFSSTGQIIWQKQLGEFLSGVNMAVAAVCVDPNNNLYFVGYATAYNNFSADSTGVDGYFGKLNSADGSTVFLKQIYLNWYPILTREDNLQGIAYSPTDNTIVVTGTSGYIDGIPQGYSSKCLIAKYTLTGEVVWNRINYYTTSTSSLNGRDVSLDSSGNIYVIFSNADGPTTLSLSSNGTRRWAVREKFTGIDSSIIIPRRIITTSNNNTVVAAFGGTTISGTAVRIATVTQYNSSGTKLWQIRPNLKIIGYAGTNPGTNGNFIGLTSDSSNNIYLAVVGISDFRVSFTYPFGNDCILLYKINGLTGSVLWIRAIKLNAPVVVIGDYNYNPTTIPTGLKCLGNFLYLVGYTNATLTTVRDTVNGVFLKIPTDGSLLSTTGFKINTQMGYKIIDVTAKHGLFTYTSTTQTVTSSISDVVYSYTQNLSLDINIPSTNGAIVRQLAVL